MMQSEINITIADKAPAVYFSELIEQCKTGKPKYGAITDSKELSKNFTMHCIPEGIEKMSIDDYDDFLQERRRLMAQKIKKYYFQL